MKNSKGFESLQSLKTEMDNQRKAEEKYWHERRNSLMEKIGFTTPEEMIEYLMSGKKIVDRQGQSFQLVDGAVEMIYEIYDECAGSMGYGKKIQTIESFKNFVYGVLAKHKEIDDDKWLPIWVKEE